MTPEDLQAFFDPALPEGDIIISTGPLLGLGDHLLYSTLARRFKALGRRVLLDGDMVTSNPEIGELVWGLNTDIDDVTDRKPNAGHVLQGLFYILANQFRGHRSIEIMERAHGLPPPYSIAPALYYAPKPTVLSLTNTVLVDYSAVSSAVPFRDLDEEMKMMRAAFPGAEFLQIIPPAYAAKHRPVVAMGSYQIASIYEYIDMLAACRAWVGSEAGGQALAAAVRGEHDVYDDEARPQIVSKIQARTFNSRGYTFRGVDYRTFANDDNGAYWRPHEVDSYIYDVKCKVRGVLMPQRGGKAYV